MAQQPTIITANDDAKAATKAAGAGIRNQSSQALVLQNYAQAVFAQSPLPPNGSAQLDPIIAKVNAGLTKAQGHAKTFTETLLPDMIAAITDLNGYFNLQNALGKALDPQAGTSTTVALLTDVLDQATSFQTKSKTLQSALTSLASEISTDAGTFDATVTQLNSAIDGDNGLLASLHDQLGSIDGKIGGAIAGVALSGLVIAGGAMLIAVGAVADFVTAGTSTPLIIVGAGVVATGVGGEVAASITLAKLIDLKGELLSEESQLKSEVKAASGMRSHYTLLGSAATSAAQAAQQMANAWGLLGGHLSNLIADVQSGAQNSGSLQTLFLTAAGSDVHDVQGDISTIETQLAGVSIRPAPSGQSLGSQIRSLAQAA